MKMIFGLLIFLLSAYEARAQLSKGDTVLYLIYDEKEYDKFVERNLNPITKKYSGSIYYDLIGNYSYYDGYPLHFQLMSRTNPDTVCAKALRGRATATINQLRDFIVSNYPSDGIGYMARSYFDHLKKIYIVENAPRKGYITITKVRIITVIEDELIEDDTLH